MVTKEGKAANTLNEIVQPIWMKASKIEGEISVKKTGHWIDWFTEANCEKVRDYAV